MKHPSRVDVFYVVIILLVCASCKYIVASSAELSDAVKDINDTDMIVAHHFMIRRE